jgi:hypothetical protein
MLIEVGRKARRDSTVIVGAAIRLCRSISQSGRLKLGSAAVVRAEGDFGEAAPDYSRRACNEDEWKRVRLHWVSHRQRLANRIKAQGLRPRRVTP